jgi:hypothetical protein
MNKSPLNYLIASATVAILWVVFAIFLGGPLSEGPSLQISGPEEFVIQLRIIFGIAAILSVIAICYWFYYGQQEKTAGELDSAKRKWNMLFLLQIFLAIGLTVAFVILNLKEGIEPKWYGIYFGVLAAMTFISYWATTYFMSPRTVKYIPLFKS